MAKTKKGFFSRLKNAVKNVVSRSEIRANNKKKVLSGYDSGNVISGGG